MKLIFITADPLQASIASAAGVDRIMVDLEVMGKDARQGHLNTVISRHTLDDVAGIRSALPTGNLMVRINPMNSESSKEISAVLDAGADQVMLPMFTTADEVERFVAAVGDGATPVLLLETPLALARLEHILDVAGPAEIHVGLNDLHLSLGLDFMFEVLSGGLLEGVSALCAARDVPFGFGGVARIGGDGPLPAEKILGEHQRLGSSQVILSRDFRQIFAADSVETSSVAFAEAVEQLRACLVAHEDRSDEETQANRTDVRDIVGRIATARGATKQTQ